MGIGVAVLQLLLAASAPADPPAVLDRVVECEGTALAQDDGPWTVRSNQVPFHAVFEFSDSEAEMTQATDSRVPTRYIGANMPDGTRSYLSREGSWILTFYKDTGRFELKNLEVHALGTAAVVRSDNISGQCKRLEKSDVFD